MPKLDPTLELLLPPVLSDTESLAAIQRDVLALYDDCAPRLMRYARSYGLDERTAEDVVHDAYVALFRHLCLGRPRHSLSGWLFRVTRNLALKQRHSASAEQESFVADVLQERVA